MPRTDHPLWQLMEKRFDVGLASKSKEKISWEHVFDEDREMPGRQSNFSSVDGRAQGAPDAAAAAAPLDRDA